MSTVVSSVRARTLALLGAFGFAFLLGTFGFEALPLVAQGDIDPCFQDCHDQAMEIEDEQGGPMWAVANHVLHACLEANC